MNDNFMKHILFLILILFCMTEIVVPQNDESSTQVARCSFYLKNEKGKIEYFLPLIFQIDNYLPTHGHVTIKYMNSSLKMDTIFCHYYPGRAILSETDYEAFLFRFHLKHLRCSWHQQAYPVLLLNEQEMHPPLKHEMHIKFYLH